MHYVVIPSLQRPNKKTIKEKLKIKARFWKNRLKKIDYLTENYVPILYLPPQQCDYVVLKICSFKSDKPPKKLYINGKQTIATNCFIRQKKHLLSNEPFAVCSLGENIISFEAPFTAEDVLLFPCFKKNPAKIFETYSCNHDVWEIFEFQAEFSCSNSVYLHKKNESISLKNKDIDENNLKIAAQYLLNCFNEDSNSDFKGTFYTAFDLDSLGFQGVILDLDIVSCNFGSFRESLN